VAGSIRFVHSIKIGVNTGFSHGTSLQTLAVAWGGPPQDLLSFWNKVPFGIRDVLYLHATCMRPSFSALHGHTFGMRMPLLGSETVHGVQCSLASTSAVILRSCTGSLAAARKGHSRACHFGTTFAVLVQISRLRRAVKLTAGRPRCPPQRVRPRTASQLPPCHPASRQLCRWQRSRRPLHGLPWDRGCLPFRGCSSHVSTALAWQAVAVQKSSAVESRGGG
jgi:hypothetical protein